MTLDQFYNYLKEENDTIEKVKSSLKYIWIKKEPFTFFIILYVFILIDFSNLIDDFFLNQSKRKKRRKHPKKMHRNFVSWSDGEYNTLGTDFK